MFGLYGRRIYSEIKEIATYADIGGCFGFGANSMAFHISATQGTTPKTVVFEIATEFVEIGKLLFPQIEFVEEMFSQGCRDVGVFDLVSMFDVVEHIVDPGSFLKQVAARSMYVMLKTPMQTSGDWRHKKLPLKQGAEHVDGHVNFFSPRTYERLLEASNLDIIESRLVPTIVPSGAWMALCPEIPKPTVSLKDLARPKHLLGWAIRGLPGIPWHLKRKLFGHDEHLCLCRSQLLDR